MKRLALPLIVAAVVAGCGRRTGNSRALLVEASETEFGSSGQPCAETIEVARRYGVDYEKLVAGCLERDRGSMHTFLGLASRGGFDAASAQGHAAVAGALLRKLGDRFFGACLAREAPSVQDDVRESLLYDLGYGNIDLTAEQIHRTYPKTFPKAWLDSQASAGSGISNRLPEQT